MDYDRGFEKVWVDGALCVRDGQALTQTASARNTTNYLALLQTLDQTYPKPIPRATSTSSPITSPAI